MTKPVVSTALMTLYEEGKFRLLDPLAAYIPGFAKVQVLDPDGTLRAPRRPPTVLDALTHASGLSYGFYGDNVSPHYRGRKFNDATVSLAQAIDDIATLPLACDPGTRWQYGVGIDVAARVAEVVAGKPLADVLQERIFAPLGMADTGFAVAEGKRGRVAAMYGRNDPMISHKAFTESFADWAAGVNDRLDLSKTYPVDQPATFQRGGHGLFGTAQDYFRFAQMLCNGGTLDGVRVIGRKTLELMHSNHLPPALLPLTLDGLPIERGFGFGLGSRVAVDRAGFVRSGSVGEFGWSGAAKTYYWVDPVEQIVALFMTQSLWSFHLPEHDLAAIVYGAVED
jgi:CubicO group peptidase (beta-lactamase class C family)